MLGKTSEGETVDVTRLCQWEGEPRTVTISPAGVVRPKAEGEEELTLRYGQFEVRLRCRVESMKPRPVSFVTDVQPVLSRLGCNAGTCHGAKEGKNGFKLSLRGYDPLFDHRSLTDDLAARRFNRAAPDQSLFLLKATGSIPHAGGVRTRVGEPYYELLRQWIVEGCRLDADAPRVVSIQVVPQDPIVPRPGMKLQTAVLATYSDGRVRDVTLEAFVESGNTEVMEAEAGGLLRTVRRGEAAVLVRYEGNYAASTVTVMGDRSGFVWNDPPVHNYIDELVYAKLRHVKVLPSELCTDDEFIRRVYLDLTGLLPPAERVRAFLADPRPTRVKRDELIDQLIGSPEYVEHWTNKWADLLQVNRKFLGDIGAAALRNWIKDAVATNMPYDQFARTILTAGGSTLENPPASYFKILRSPDALMENTTHLFLAIRFNCNKCHDHPFERWTQDQYYHLAAFFAQVDLKADPRFADQRIGGTAVEGAKPLVEIVYDKNAGEVTHLRTGKVAEPAFPFDFGLQIDPQLPRREQLARWLTSPENPYFARSFVNRLWGYLFGVGIIEPIDDIRAGNPPTNPQLLDALTQDFIQSGFDIQHMLRTICQSRVYQHSVATNSWNEDDKINFSHAMPRRLTAEALFDAIHVAAGAQPRIPGVPAGMRAAELPDAGVSLPFLEEFGRPPRESACECERSSGVFLGPILKLINGPVVGEALTQPGNALERLVNELPDDEKVIEEVFLRFLARYPTAQEKQAALEVFRQAGSELDALRQELTAYEAQLDERQRQWEENVLRTPVWQVLVPKQLGSQAGAQFTIESDGVIKVTGNNGKDVYTFEAETMPAGITGIKIEALPDPSLAAGGPGRAGNGNFVLSELRAFVRGLEEGAERQPVAFRSATADFSQQGWPVAAAIDGNPGTGWAIAPQFGKPHTAIFELAEPIATDGGKLLVLEFDQQYPDGTHTLGKFRVSVTTSPAPLEQQVVPDAIRQALASGERTEEQKRAIRDYFRQQDERWKQLSERVATAEKLLANRRLVAVQDLAWALINTPAFLFNR
ncbi:MAG: hypothetical protein KatS3mg110_3925 [Pirellulaceae bacterium]|nr:MAG: hypothetical protein KatS3mg110_3925 [Pirellulaceae bacterium]